MKRVRLNDLSASFTDDGQVRMRSWTHGFSARVPASAIGVLAFCSDPRDESEIVAEFGPSAASLFRDLTKAGLLVEPDDVASTPVFFTNFAAVDLHRRMLGDVPRVDGYRRALAELAPGKSVLDAGTGSGVLAGLAALEGADRVVAVDKAEIVEAAAENMRRSGLADKVTVVRADIADVVVSEPVDIIVTETFGAMALVEGAAADVAACAAKNLAEGGVVIPHAIDFYLAPVSDPAVRQEFLAPFDSIEGLDLSALSDTAKQRGVIAAIAESSLLAPGGRFSSIPFPAESSARGTTAITCPAGMIVGLAGWFDLRMTPTQILSTAPGATPTVWGQSFFPLGPLEVEEGDVLMLKVSLDPAPDDRRGCVMELEWEVGVQGGRISYRFG